jgi:hypothetical protein
VEEPLAVTNILGSGTEKILVTAQVALPPMYHMTEEKIDVPPNMGNAFHQTECISHHYVRKHMIAS